jgi:hypothetical protein
MRREFIERAEALPGGQISMVYVNNAAFDDAEDEVLEARLRFPDQAIGTPICQSAWNESHGNNVGCAAQVPGSALLLGLTLKEGTADPESTSQRVSRVVSTDVLCDPVQ